MSFGETICEWFLNLENGGLKDSVVGFMKCL